MATRRPALHFLGGVSGAGKSTLLSQATQSGVRLERISGGQMIAAASQATEGPYMRPDVKDADNAAANQELLLEGLEVYMAHADERVPIVFDGHFVIPSRTGLVPVDTGVFRRMAPASLLLLSASPNDVALVLRRRPIPAVWWDGDIATIQRFCTEEERHAHLVASALNVPLTIFDRVRARAVLARVLHTP